MYGENFYSRHTAQITRMWQWNRVKQNPYRKLNTTIMKIVTGSVWLSLFMDVIGKWSYRPRPLAPAEAEFNI
jgi:hypothetical protein